jgi:hypothetical protein
VSLAELLEYVKAGGGLLAPIFAILFWLERGERQDAQKELRQVSERSIVAMVELKSLVGQLAAIFKSNGGD